ncbi:MAG: hypothetical protein OGM67_13315 [Oscillospiraceae bacterium]|nr:MAG: hypothetical protein OGM67_13315 [Oscillospiraceae bacterium]
MLYAGGLSHWLAAGGLAAGIVGGAALLALRPGLLKGYQFKRILAVLTRTIPRWRTSPTSRTRVQWPLAPAG